MLQFALKVLITAIVVVAVAELAKRSSVWAAVLASLPLTSLLAFIWLYVETEDPGRIAILSGQIFWLVVPSLLLFVVLPLLLRAGVNFWLSLAISVGATAVAYAGTLWLLRRFGAGA
ncbi:MAG: DUF3147 family protein [Burkholderiales bacterium]